MDENKGGESKSAEGGLSEKSSRLDTSVAIAVAMVSTFMGICAVKDDNIVQGMQKAQVEKLDNWAFYQARNIRQEIADAELAQLQVTRIGKTGEELAQIDATIKRYKEISASQESKKEQLAKVAREQEALYNELNNRDDQFDLSDAMLTIAVAMLAVTALTGQWWLFWLSGVPIAGGVVMGLAGLLQWDIRPEALFKLLN